jgi:galactokinase
MWRIASSRPLDLPDLGLLHAALGTADAAGRPFFDRSAPVAIGRGPGRLDLMGGIADYSGALVLELPLAVAAYAAAQEADEPFVTVRSLADAAIGGATEVRLPLEALMPGGEPLSYAEAHALLTAEPRTSWAAYIAGTLVALMLERGLRPRRGLRILVASDVPAGKGVSSSAAIEVATMSALRGLYGAELDGRDLAILCQRVENLVVGAPCGVMDQMTSALGEGDRLLALLCQPAEPQASVPLPPEVEVWGIDSGIRHAVSGADYGSVRVGAFMGYRIVVERAGLTVRGAEGGRVTVEDPLWGGYLANIPPSLWESAYRDAVPETLRGDQFLERYGGTTDSVTRVEPARTYAVRQPTAHPIYEHHRVRLFRALLESLSADDEPPHAGGVPVAGGSTGHGADTAAREAPPRSPAASVPERLVLLGELMYQSHASYSACGLGSDGTDRLVELVREAGPGAGLFGAKITGGGSGGTVAVLARRGALEAVREVAGRYERETGRATTLLGGSSPGAAQLGSLRATWE